MKVIIKIILTIALLTLAAAYIWHFFINEFNHILVPFYGFTFMLIIALLIYSYNKFINKEDFDTSQLNSDNESESTEPLGFYQGAIMIAGFIAFLNLSYYFFALKGVDNSTYYSLYEKDGKDVLGYEKKLPPRTSLIKDRVRKEYHLNYFDYIDSTKRNKHYINLRLKMLSSDQSIQYDLFNADVDAYLKSKLDTLYYGVQQSIQGNTPLDLSVIDSIDHKVIFIDFGIRSSTIK